jgi:hypothetical protein
VDMYAVRKKMVQLTETRDLRSSSNNRCSANGRMFYGIQIISKTIIRKGDIELGGRSEE